MNVTSAVGILAGFALIAWSIATGSVPWLAFIDFPSITIVVGGVTAAIFISTPFPEIKRVFHAVGMVLARPPPSYVQYISYVVDLAKVAKKSGVASLEDKLPQITEPFLRDGVQMLADGHKLEEIRSIMEERIVNRVETEKAEANLLYRIANFSPSFGLLGTLIGLIQMLSNMSTSNLDKLGPAMGVAIITTFYGVLLSACLFKPLAMYLEKRTKERVKLMHMVLESLVMIVQQWHPTKVQEYLNSYVQPGKRQRPTEHRED